MMYVDAVDYIRKFAELLLWILQQQQQQKKKEKENYLEIIQDNSDMNWWVN